MAKPNKIDPEGRDICSACDKDFEYGTLQDISEEGFELICPACIQKKLAEHELMLKALKNAYDIVDGEYPKDDERYQDAQKWKTLIDEVDTDG